MTRTITYHRGNSSVQLQATLGQTSFEQSDEYGIVQKVESRDFLVRTGDLILEGQMVLPSAGDLIRDMEAGSVFVCEVSAPGHEPPFRYSDPYRKALRIHTKHIATEIV
ncbi:MAG: hypothetical protein IT430_20775 [Phycisphaerales bacterium]|nr:hypothetical protein [Phycisphaerales bacterium]